MRVFTSFTTRVTTLRRKGFYPSKRVAEFLADRFVFVLGLPLAVTGSIVNYLRSGCAEEVNRLLTPAEMQALEAMLSWWAVDEDLYEHEHAYVCVNINDGRTLVVIDQGKRPSSVI